MQKSSKATNEQQKTASPSFCMKETREEGIETGLARNLGRREAVGEMKIKTFFKNPPNPPIERWGGDGIDLSSLLFLYAV